MTGAGDKDREVKMGIWSTGSPSYIHPKNNKYDYLGNAVKNNKGDSVGDKKYYCGIRSATVR